MREDSWVHRVRWANVGGVAVVIGCLALALAWPRLAPTAPEPPPAAVVPARGLPPLAGAAARDAGLFDDGATGAEATVAGGEFTDDVSDAAARGEKRSGKTDRPRSRARAAREQARSSARRGAQKRSPPPRPEARRADRPVAHTPAAAPASPSPRAQTPSPPAQAAPAAPPPRLAPAPVAPVPPPRHQGQREFGPATSEFPGRR